MAGTFSKNARPKRPGAYFNFVVREPEPTLVNSLGTVVIPFTHSWGPTEVVTPLANFGEFLSIFGRGAADLSTFTEGYKAVLDAFRGEDVDGRGGAGQVLAYRMAASSAAAASKVVDSKITLTAVWPGTYGQQITYTITPDATDTSTHDNLTIYVEGIEAERFKYAKTNITDLAAQINGTSPYSDLTASDWVRGSSVTSGAAIAAQATQSALTGGDDGSSNVLASDWTAFMDALAPHRFTLLAPANLTDKTILTSLVAWSANANAKGKRHMLVIGGAAGESFSDAVTGSASVLGSQAINNPNVVRLGIGTYVDERYGQVSTAQLAPRLAGILAWRGEALPLTFARVNGLSISWGPLANDYERAMDNGIVVIARDSHPTAPVRLEEGVTTYLTTTNPGQPKNIFGNPKFMRSMHGIEMELTEFAEMEVIGLLPVNAGTRDHVRGQMMARLQRREDAGIILSGWTVNISSDPPPSDLDSFISLDYEVQFGRGLSQILNNVTVG